MKSYTDLEQSKKLAKILPLKSADMYYLYDEKMEMYDDYPRLITDTDELWDDDTPCWSLAALLDLLPNNEHIETTISRGSWKIDTVEYLPNTWWCAYEDTKNQTEFNKSADNPVDACVEMIIKLHEQKLL